ncbi:hypothetical protein FRC06_001735 [Ceratobasidium sp. 370]|nr:hypothetical protein FRC06_001735 [Ceratobasidium sp. 370]
MQSSFINRVFRAGDEALCKCRKAMPGHTYQPRTRKVQIVPSDSIPELKHGNKILKIPYYAFGKSWCQKNKKLMTDFAHHIDFDRKTPPDISHFLEANQKREDLDKDTVVNEGPVPVPMGEHPQLDVVDREEEGENGNKGGDEGDGQCIEGDEEFGKAADLDDDDEAARQEMELDPNAERAYTFDASNIDPALLEQPEKPSRAVKPKPKPKAIEDNSNATPTASVATTSAIHIKIPPFQHVSKPLPNPLTYHQPQMIAQPTTATLQPTPESPIPQTIVQPQYPLGGPQYSPPMPTPAAQLASSSAGKVPPKSKKQKGVTEDEDEALGREKEKKKRGRPMKAEQAAKLAATAATSSAVPSGSGQVGIPVATEATTPVIQKRGPGRPRKMKEQVHMQTPTQQE